MDIYQLALPGKVCFGVGSIARVKDEALRLSARRALIVTDPGVYQAGVVDPIKELLSGAGIQVDVFSESELEPTLPRVNAIAGDLRGGSYDLLLGVGGGSSLDTAKALSVVLAHGGKAEDYLGNDKVPGPGIPLFAIPTTSGTGSEATTYAILGDPKKQLKLAIISVHLLARVAVVDPVLTYKCPPRVTAAAGIDALTHAVECYTSIKANRFSDSLALEAIRLISASLVTAVRNGADGEARSHMAEGALFAGIAFGNSSVGAVHALAYPLGSRFHVAHGVANGLFLPYVMQASLSANPARYATVAQALGVETEGLSPEEAAEQAVAAVRRLVADSGIPSRLRDLGVPRDSLDGMARDTMEIDRLLSANAKLLTKEEVRQIWIEAW